MTGVELMVVWLFGIFCGALTVCSVVKSIASSRAVSSSVGAVANAKVAMGSGLDYPPPAWFGKPGKDGS